MSVLGSGTRLRAHVLEAIVVAVVMCIVGCNLDGADPQIGRLYTVFPSDPSENQQFGTAVAASGSHAVISAREAVPPYEARGEAYFFSRDGTAWRQQQKFQGEAGDGFGIALGMFGTTAVVGAPTDITDGLETGAAFVYGRVEGEWVLQQKITPAAPVGADEFGSAFAFDSGLLVVGASASAHVFEWDGTVWIETHRLVPDGPYATGAFGAAVAVSGDTILIGDFADPETSTSAGAAYVFELINGDWLQQQKLRASDGAWYDQFGRSVALWGDTAIVGALSHEGGAAYVFRRDAGVWTEVQIMVNDVSGAGGGFAWSVAMSADLVVIGAPWYTEFPPGVPSVHVFEPTGGVWTRMLRAPGPDSTNGSMGESIALTGDDVLIGAPRDDSNGAWSGSAIFLRVR